MEKYVNANAILSKFCQKYNALKKDLPIRPSEMGVLNIIVQREGLFTPIMLADLLEVSKPMITAHISVLKSKGYIRKQSLKEDKRSFYVVPTERAKELVKTTADKMNGLLRELENKLGTTKFNVLLELVQDSNEFLKSEVIKGEGL